MNTGKLFVLSAPSGTGKTTILKEVMENISGLVFSISHTTRMKRQGEQDGVDYHFVSKDTFLQMREQNSFLESAEVHGNYYGTSREAVEDQLQKGIDVILDIDVQGADIIRTIEGLPTTYIFLAPPSMQELENRLRSRGLDDENTIVRRLTNARDELDAKSRYEYLIINDEIKIAVKMFESVVLAERARSGRKFDGSAL